MLLDQRASRRTTIAVNVAKFALLAALTPPVIVGIAQRASEIGVGVEVAGIVATTVSLGSLSAVVGALLLGALADARRASLYWRWGWVTISTVIGTGGLIVLSASTSLLSLTLGWLFAQFGYSGAMAVLRVILATALPEHRRRGAVIVVLGSYGGLALALALLLAFPHAIWQPTFGLALIGLTVPCAVMVFMRGDRNERMGREDPASAARTGVATSAPSRRWLLTIQCAANIVVSIFITYHPLELAGREGSLEIPVTGSVVIIAAAVAGLLLTTGLLIWKPVLLTNSSSIIAIAGVMLGSSLMVRAVADSFLIITLAASMSGAAVGLNSSALFTAALEHARRRSGGTLMGVYSAAGALGQVFGPMIALALLFILSRDQIPLESDLGYRALFFIVGVAPLVWSAAIKIGHTFRANKSEPSYTSEATEP